MELLSRASPGVVLALLVCSLTRLTQAQSDSCTRADYEKCVKIADPLMKDPHLIFPDNMADIDVVCRRWSQFVDCVKRYTDKCFTETRRQDFNKAIASPVDSVHQMCTDSNYQKEYLMYAACIKSTLIKDAHCGRHYKHLVEQVSGEVSRVTLCCSHHRFRECVLAETKRECDRDKENGPAQRFSRQILDKALSFIRDQCYNYIPSSGYCPGIALPGPGKDESGNALPDLHHGPTSHRPWQPNPQGPDKRVTASGETNAGHPWLPNTRTPSRTTEDRGARDKWGNPAGTMKPVMSQDKPTSWMPTVSTKLPQTTTPTPLFHAITNLPAVTPDETRPSSYGRGMTWTPTNTEPADWFNKTWKVSSQDELERDKHKVDTWRPKVAGFGGGIHNHVDEPNQQGLANKNTATACRFSVHVLAAVAMLYLVLY